MAVTAVALCGSGRVYSMEICMGKPNASECSLVAVGSSLFLFHDIHAGREGLDVTLVGIVSHGNRPMEKLSFSYMDDDGLNESLLHVPQSDYGLNTGEMTIPEQADEVLSRCNL